MSAPAEFALRRDHRVRGVWLMLLSTTCFTINVLLIRALGQIQAVDIWLVSAARFAVGVALLATVYWRDVQFGRVFKKWKLAGRGIIGGLGVAFYYVTVVHLGAGRATFINNTYIIIAGLMAVWIVRETFRRTLGIGSAAALFGLALLTNAFAGGSRGNGYDLLAVGTAFASAYVVVTIRLLHADGERTTTIFAAQCVYGLLLCAVPAGVHFGPISLWAWVLMIGAGICAAIGQLAMTGGFRDLPVAEGSLLQMLVPLEIALGGFAFFHERLAPHELVGAALIVAGTAFTLLRW